jgi:DNA primase
MLGCVGRSVVGHKFKWINSKGFSKSKHLYNYGKALVRAGETGAMVLSEGQGDIMRFHESGVFNVVGLFGCHLSDAQQILLEQSGVLTLVLVMDMDKAGQRGKDDILEKCRYLFNVVEVRLPSGKDVGDFSVKHVQENILPQIKDYV